MENEKISIQDQIEEIKAQICNYYCKFPGMYDKETEELELCESQICQNCPLTRL